MPIFSMNYIFFDEWSPSEDGLTVCYQVILGYLSTNSVRFDILEYSRNTSYRSG